jgi:hypothetical protein
MKKIITILFFCFVFFGCQLTVDIDVPFEKSQLTLNSLFSTDSVWNVKLNLNRHILDKSPFATVDNASVVILENEVVIETLASKGNGVYQSSGKPIAGKTYTVKATAENYGSVQSTASLPLPVQNLKVIFHEPTQGESGLESVIDLKFDDPPGEKNFYKMTAFGEAYSVAQHKKIAKTTAPILLKRQGSNNDDNGEEEIIMSDLLFDGETHQMSIKTGNWFYGFSNITLSVSAISEEYYNYKETIQLQSETRDNPFAQPVNVFNNIIGGFGFFGGYTRSNVSREMAQPKIINISPLKGKPGDHVVLTYESNLPPGTSVSPFIQPNRVFFNGVDNFVNSQTIIQTPGSIEFIVPSNCITGTLVVFINGFPIFSNQVFEVTN